MGVPETFLDKNIVTHFEVEFFDEVQQPKMKELWDNKEDEIWRHL